MRTRTCRAIWSTVLLASTSVWAETAAPTAPVAAEKVYDGAIEEIRLEPTRIHLKDSLDAARVLVTGRTPQGEWVDLTRQATVAIVAAEKFGEASPIARRDADGFFLPQSDGQAIARFSVAGKTAEAPIAISGTQAPRTISYVRDVMPILSKSGCNSGPCHGTPKGKRGFKLSLRGYDPEWDHEQLITDLSSRRFNRSRPTDSLLIMKPTNEVPHEGGFRFGTDHRYYRVLLQWIREGNQSDVTKMTRANGIRVYPEHTTLREPGAWQDVVVVATYPDGSTRDVTRDAEFTASPDYVARVAEPARVQALRRGEVAILIRYEGNYAVKYLSVLDPRPDFVWSSPAAHNYIDHLVDKKLQRLKILPAALADDATFLRRVYLDLIGSQPTPEEIKAFLVETTPTKLKRARVIDELLDRPEFVDRWAYKWADLLQCNRKYLGDKGVWAFRNWIRQQVATNRPLDEFVREMLTATGSTYENPAANFYKVARDPLKAMEDTTHLFMGIRFNCNKCHDHPFERWTQTQHYELGAYFASVQRKAGLKPGEEIVYDLPSGYEPVKHPRTQAVIPPKFPFEHAGPYAAAPTLRQQLADWLTAPENPYFARSIVNRFWSYMLGLGVIEPVDDIRSSNPPSNPELLDALTKDFVDHGFDLKHLLRTIANSRTYQLSIETNSWNEDDKINFSHALPRRLTAEQLQDSISAAMGIPIPVEGLPAGFRASQLPDTAVRADFLETFGRPPRESVCECERVAEVSLKQTLSLINGPTLGSMLADPNGRLNKLAASGSADPTLANEIYLTVLCRAPSDEERTKAVEYLAAATSKAEGVQDLAWALFNSAGFLFNR
ncbi:DUF1549 and DUF1553 domain-containing protein [bacterium]|nr:DUF1549 and DUF1553 domain-containing protein [bacterium]